eukprot:3118633-Alexandrium_andersonii.AAC.1
MSYRVRPLPLRQHALSGCLRGSPQATVGFFPVDGHTLQYLRTTGRPEEQVAALAWGHRMIRHLT